MKYRAANFPIVAGAFVAAACSGASPDATPSDSEGVVPEPNAEETAALVPFVPISAPQTYDDYSNDSIHFNPLGCPSEWPARVQAVLDSARVRPVSERCQSVVADFNGDGLDDIVVTADAPQGAGYVAVLDADRPTVEWLAPLDEVIWAVPAGDHQLEGCFDNPADRSNLQVRLPFPGFSVASDYYHFEAGDWVIQNKERGC